MIKTILQIAFLFLLTTTTVVAQEEAEKETKVVRPNILWIVQEDLSPWLGCYGHEIQKGHTPNIDALADRGIRFSRAFVPSPVCSTCRSAIITGAFAFRFGAHEHRSRRGEATKPLPPEIRSVPDLLTEQGYFCFNIGKTDYNFSHEDMYQEVPKELRNTPWRARPDDKPFFGQIQLNGGKLKTKNFANKCDRSKVSIPGDYPQNDLYREVVAQHYDAARMDDENVGKIIKRLTDDGLIESTIVVYFSDHGANNLVRHKQQPTEGGSHVPLIMAGPIPGFEKPKVRGDVVSLLDLSATTLFWGGLPKCPKWVEGQALLGDPGYRPRRFVGTGRDRCDQTIDRIRSIRSGQFRYTRNYMLDRVLLQPQYRDKREPVKYLRQAYAEGKLDMKLANIYFGERPAEEFYDVKVDPAQLNNLVKHPKYRKQLDRHRKMFDKWIAAGDKGAEEEPEIELKMANHERWGFGVNPEYEKIRTDSDGDGLSDKWEEINHRDPKDGKLQFLFDCGGWQTEGWYSEGDVSNIAGMQGYLDFQLPQGTGSIVRDNLALDSAKNKGDIVLSVKTNQNTNITFSANGKSLGQQKLSPGLDFTDLKFSIDKFDQDQIKSLRVDFESGRGTNVVIDKVVTADSQ